MRATTTASLLAAALLLGGCMTGTGPDDSRAPLEKVQKADYDGDVLWLEPGADRPVFESRLDDVETANPVRVEFYEDLAVAWYAPEGEALYGHQNIMGLWRIWDHTSDPQPLSDDVAPDDETTRYEPSLPELVPEEDEPQFDTTDVTVSSLPYAILDWRNRFGEPVQDELIQTLYTRHPGCLEP